MHLNSTGATVLITLLEPRSAIRSVWKQEKVLLFSLPHFPAISDLFPGTPSDFLPPLQLSYSWANLSPVHTVFGKVGFALTF